MNTSPAPPAGAPAGSESPAPAAPAPAPPIHHSETSPPPAAAAAGTPDQQPRPLVAGLWQPLPEPPQQHQPQQQQQQPQSQPQPQLQQQQQQQQQQHSQRQQPQADQDENDEGADGRSRRRPVAPPTSPALDSAAGGALLDSAGAAGSPERTDPASADSGGAPEPAADASGNPGAAKSNESSAAASPELRGVGHSSRGSSQPASGHSSGSNTPGPHRRSAHRSRAGPKVGEHGNWRCVPCGNVNFSYRNRCNKCQLLRPTFADGADGNWTCPGCTNVNFSHRNKCNRCQQTRPTAADLVDGVLVDPAGPAKAEAALLSPAPVTASGPEADGAQEESSVAGSADSSADSSTGGGNSSGSGSGGGGQHSGKWRSRPLSPTAAPHQPVNFFPPLQVASPQQHTYQAHFWAQYTAEQVAAIQQAAVNFVHTFVGQLDPLNAAIDYLVGLRRSSMDPAELAAGQEMVPPLSPTPRAAGFTDFEFATPIGFAPAGLPIPGGHLAFPGAPGTAPELHLAQPPHIQLHHASRPAFHALQQQQQQQAAGGGGGSGQPRPRRSAGPSAVPSRRHSGAGLQHPNNRQPLLLDPEAQAGTPTRQHSRQHSRHQHQHHQQQQLPHGLDSQGNAGAAGSSVVMPNPASASFEPQPRFWYNTPLPHSQASSGYSSTSYSPSASGSATPNYIAQRYWTAAAASSSPSRQSSEVIVYHEVAPGKYVQHSQPVGAGPAGYEQLPEGFLPHPPGHGHGHPQAAGQKPPFVPPGHLQAQGPVGAAAAAAGGPADGGPAAPAMDSQGQPLVGPGGHPSHKHPQQGQQPWLGAFYLVGSSPSYPATPIQGGHAGRRTSSGQRMAPGARGGLGPAGLQQMGLQQLGPGQPPMTHPGAGAILAMPPGLQQQRGPGSQPRGGSRVGGGSVAARKGAQPQQAFRAHGAHGAGGSVFVQPQGGPDGLNSEGPREHAGVKADAGMGAAEAPEEPLRN